MNNECIRERCYCWTNGGAHSCKKMQSKVNMPVCPYPTSSILDDDDRDYSRAWMVKRDAGLKM